MRQTLLFNEMRILLEDYERTLTKMEKVHSVMPAGSLSEKQVGNSLYLFRDLKLDGKYMQIPIPQNTNDGVQLITSLQRKRLCYHGMPMLKKNIRALRSALRQLTAYDPACMIHSSFPTKAPDAYFLPGQLNVQKWIDDTLAGNFQINPHKPEKRKIPTADGHLTRSKSEELWCDILAAESLLYRYDSDFRLASGRTVYPDFTVLHQRERRLIRIEHFGLMDDPKYAIDQLYKLEEYAQSGLLPGRDLFFTVETKDRPLTRDRIYEVLYRSGLLTTTA